jgi:pilus assembly protein Flp/PilA
MKKTERPMTAIKRFLADESGATAVEYGLLTALLSVVMIGSLQALGSGLRDTFSIVSTQLAAIQ